jgi:hypothetical protein
MSTFMSSQLSHAIITTQILLPLSKTFRHYFICLQIRHQFHHSLETPSDFNHQSSPPGSETHHPPSVLAIPGQNGTRSAARLAKAFRSSTPVRRHNHHFLRPLCQQLLNATITSLAPSWQRLSRLRALYPPPCLVGREEFPPIRYVLISKHCCGAHHQLQ